MTETQAARPRDAAGDSTAQALSLQAHRRIIGTLGLILPPTIYLVAGARPTAGLEDGKLLDSVSAYYYTGAVGVFLGVLFALSLFLLSYRGYKNFVADRIVGAVAGLAAIVVVLFPTGAPPGVPSLLWWGPATGRLHYAAAAVLFTSFIVFSIWLFRKSDTPRRQDRPRDKRVRDDICLVCGLVMIVAVLWAAITNGPIFFPESVAIIAFAVSWLTKGEAHAPFVRAVKSLMGPKAPGTAVPLG